MASVDMTFVAASDRPEINFGMDGFGSREHLLFKSLVRLVDHRSDHQWFYCPDQAQLWVQSLQVEPQCSPPGSVLTKLMVGSVPIACEYFLQLPLKSNEIEASLNQLGKVILLARHAAAHAANLALIPETPATYRLKRWPTSALVTGPKHTKLATILISNPITLKNLAQRSGLSEEVCVNFLNSLRTAGFLDESVPSQEFTKPQVIELPVIPKNNVEAAKAPLSLFARIRARLAQQLSL